MKPDYKKTTYACFIGYIVQAVVNSFVPLLFVTFQNTYQIPLTKITLLITINFVIQLLVDLLSAGFIDKIGYRVSVVLAHICVAAGLVMLTILPEVFADPFLGILCSVVIYAVGIDLCGAGTRNHENNRRSGWSDGFFHFDGNIAPDLWKIWRQNGSGPVYEIKHTTLHLFVSDDCICANSGGRTGGLCNLWLFGWNYVAGNVQQSVCVFAEGWNCVVCTSCVSRRLRLLRRTNTCWIRFECIFQ